MIQMTEKRTQSAKGTVERQPVNWKVTTGIAGLTGAVASVLSAVVTMLSQKSPVDDSNALFLRVAEQCLKQAIEQ